MINIILSVFLFAFPASFLPHYSPADTAGFYTEVADYLSAHEQNKTFSGNIFIRKNDTVFYWTAGNADFATGEDFSTDSRFRIGSVTKPFTATLIMMLVDQELIDLDAPVSEYLPEIQGTSAYTTRQLLAHTSGLPNYTNLPEFISTLEDEVTMEELLNRFIHLSLDFEPGTRFSYSNSGYVVLSAVIEAVTGKSYKEAIRSMLIEPFGLENTGYETSPTEAGIVSGYRMQRDFEEALPIHMSIPTGAGALYSNGPDLLRFWDVIRDENYFPEEYFEKMTIRVKGDYALGWAVGPVLNRRTVGHAGGINGFATNFINFTDLDEEINLIILANLETAPIGPIARDLSAIIFDESYQAPAVYDEMEIDEEILKRYTGMYNVAPNFDIEITIEDGDLFLQATGQPKFELFAISEHEFFLRVAEARITFEINDEGETTGLTLVQAGQTVPAQKVE